MKLKNVEQEIEVIIQGEFLMIFGFYYYVLTIKINK